MASLVGCSAKTTVTETETATETFTETEEMTEMETTEVQTEETEAETLGDYTFTGADDFDPACVEGKKLIAITVDDGPDGTGTEDYISIAREFDIPLTFFVVGKNIPLHADQLQEMLDAGCEIGNHSYSHDYLNELSEAEVQEEVLKTNQLIHLYAEDAVVNFVRAPYFAYSDTLSSAVSYPMIDCTFSESDSVDATLEALKGAADGDIVLLHAPKANSREALRQAIPYLQEEGFAFVTVSQLFTVCGVDPISGSVYKHVGRNTISDYSSSENLFTGEAFASGDWDNWAAAVELDAATVAAMTEDMAIKVEYEGTAGPCFILADWNDGGPSWIQLPPSYDDGRTALFTYDDLYSNYGFGDDLSTVDSAQIRPWGADLTVTGVEMIKK